MVDVLTVDGINNYLDSDLVEKLEIKIEECVDSTNRIVKELAKTRADEGYVLISNHQTAGRGRLGRSFFSPNGTGLYMSILLRPEIKPQDATLITTAAAVSVCKALEKLNVNNPVIKWVNDVFIDGKKVCGILTEGNVSSNEKMAFVVLGLGINIYKPQGDFPEELKEIAGGVFLEKIYDLKNKFIAFFLNDFFKRYDDLLSRKHLREYEKRCFLIGEKVSFMSNECEKNAKVVGIDGNCGLRVVYDDGTEQILSSGEVSVRL